jgi:hypothetical protein
MRKLIGLLMATLALGGAVDAAAVAGTASPALRSRRPVVAVFAKTCPHGYTHAVIGGHQKCLHAGEYCAHRFGRQYRRYHFKCVIVNGTYRLERT